MDFSTTSLVALIFIWCEVDTVKSGAYDLEFWKRDPKYDFRADDSKKPLNKVPTTKADWFELHRLQKENKNRNEAIKTQLRFGPGPLQPNTMLSGNRRRGTHTIEMGAVPNFRVMSDLYKSYVNNMSRGYDQQRINKKKRQKLRERFRKGRRVIFHNTTKAIIITTTAGSTGVKAKATARKDKSGSKKLSPYSLAQFLESLALEYKEVNITQEIVGKTVAYNDIVLLKISEGKSEVSKYFRADEGKYMEESANKKIIFIVHGLSAMGFNNLACLSEVNKFKQLLKYYLEHLDKFDIYLIPMANPDGVTMNQPLWNKNTSPQDACAGVALDRNFDVAWNETRKVTSCSQQFPGTSPFSEIETKAIREVFHRFSQNIAAYLHVHAGTYSPEIFKGEAVLYPKGYSEVQSEDDKYIDLKGEVDEAMKNASFNVISVTVDTLYSWYGKVTGSSVDYASSIYGIPYAMELVMQLYTNDQLAQNSSEKETNIALKEIWKRLINVIFKNIHRNSN